MIKAEDRAHRVGQIRDVTVIRIILESSIEEHIYNSAQLKLELDASVSMNKSDNGGSGKNDEMETKSIMALIQLEILNNIK